MAMLSPAPMAPDAGALPEALAMDGKMIRDQIGLLTLASHDNGAPRATAIHDKKEGAQRCEQTAAQTLLENTPDLENKIITADALHCQRQTAALIAGGAIQSCGQKNGVKAF